jgi:hypothetical protein
LSKQPLCEWCHELGIVTAATVAHHTVAHRGDAELFWNGELQSLCASCHSSRAQSEEAAETPVKTWRR